MDTPPIRPLWASLLLVLVPVNVAVAAALIVVGVGGASPIPVWGGFVAIASANCLAGGIFLSWIGARLAAISDSARSFIDEGQTAQIPHSSIKEIRWISESLDQIRDRVGEQVELLTTQRNEQESVLQSMQVGVIAIDVE